MTGVTTIREQVLGVLILGDLADAVSEVDQSFPISGVTALAASNDQSATNLPLCLNFIAGTGEQ